MDEVSPARQPPLLLFSQPAPHQPAPRHATRRNKRPLAPRARPPGPPVSPAAAWRHCRAHRLRDHKYPLAAGAQRREASAGRGPGQRCSRKGEHVDDWCARLVWAACLCTRASNFPPHDRPSCSAPPALEDKELHIQLQKARNGETWASALKNHGELDPIMQVRGRSRRNTCIHHPRECRDSCIAGLSPRPTE